MDEKEYLKLGSYFKYFSDLLIDKIFNKKTIRFSQPWIMNDPLEFNPIIKFHEKNEYDSYNLHGIIMPSMNDWFRIQLIESKVNDYGILSLTKNPYSYTMWNHYGNGHKGFLVEFKNNFNEHDSFKSKDNDIYPVKKVDYVEEFIIDISKISDDTGMFLDEDFNEHFFYLKTNRWEYEKEYRFVRNLKDFDKEYKTNVDYREDKKIYCGSLPLEVIETVTFGAHMSQSNKQKIVNLLKDTNIEFNQAIVYKDEKDSENQMGKVEIILLAKDNLKSTIELLPQVFSCEKKKINNGEIVKIREFNY